MKTMVTNVLCPYGDHILVTQPNYLECRNEKCVGYKRRYGLCKEVEIDELSPVATWWEAVMHSQSWHEDLRGAEWADLSDLDRDDLRVIYEALV